MARYVGGSVAPSDTAVDACGDFEQLAALRAEIAALRRESILREDVRPMIRQMEGALLAIALSKNTANERIARQEVLSEQELR